MTSPHTPPPLVRPVLLCLFTSVCLLLTGSAQMPERSDQADVRSLIEQLKDHRPDARRRAAAALGNIGPEAKDSVPALIKVLSDPEVEVRIKAAIALGRIGAETKAAVPALIEALRDRIKFVRSSAASSLGQIGAEAKAAVPALVKALRDPEVEVRESAARALGNIGPEAKDSVPALINTLKDRIKFVRRGAALALGNIGPEAKAAVPALVKALSDPEVEVRESAALALGGMGAQAKAAVPALVEALSDENEFVRNSSADALGNISTVFARAEDIDAISQLKSAHRALQSSSDPNVRAHADRVQQTIDYLELLWWEQLKRWVAAHPLISLAIATYPLLLLACLALLWLRPLWLLQFNDKLSNLDFTLPSWLAWLGGTKSPLRYLLLVGFFRYHPRVLDAWAEEHVDDYRTRFDSLDIVRERSVHVPVPVLLNKNTVPHLTGKHLRDCFSQNNSYLLIHGEGGSGKTSFACQIAEWAMSPNKDDRLCKHLMFPVLIEQDLVADFPANSYSLVDAIRDQLQALIGETVPLSGEVVERLLRYRRILVVVDHFSELNEETRGKIRPERADFPARALVVTSRMEENLGGVPKTRIKTQRIEGRTLSEFMDDYLKERGARNLFDDPEYFSLCGRLTMMVGDREITVLLAKLYADQMITLKNSRPADELFEDELPDNIPDLMLRYLNELSRSARNGDPDERTVHRYAKIIAWECLKYSYRPAPARRDAILMALSGETEVEQTLAYLEERLRVVQTIGAGRDKVRVSLDPLAEYLAGLHLVEQHKGDETPWHKFLQEAETKDGYPEAVKGFLLAVRDCCLTMGVEPSHKVPDFVGEELARRAGLGASSQYSAKIEPRLKRLMQRLTLADSEDPAEAAESLGRMRQDAKPAVNHLVQLLSDPSADVRRSAAPALRNIDPEVKASVPALTKAVSDPSKDVRSRAAST